MANLDKIGQWEVGQKVVVASCPYGRVTKRIDTIKKITDGWGGTIYVGETQYNVRGSSRGSNAWTRSNIQPATEKDYEEIKKLRARSFIQRANLEKLDGDLAIKTIEFLKENGFDVMDKANWK